MGLPAKDKVSDRDSADQKSPERGISSDWSFAAAPRTGISLNSNRTASLHGIGVYVMRHFDGQNFRLNVGITGAAELGVNGANEYENSLFKEWSFGGVLGVGAPFDRSPMGVLVEGGYHARVGSLTRRDCNPALHQEEYGDPTGEFVCKAHPFSDETWQLRGALVFQPVTSSALRPWLAASIRGIFYKDTSVFLDLRSYSNTNVVAGLDLGIAWDP
jgi:hypothetical protein